MCILHSEFCIPGISLGNGIFPERKRNRHSFWAVPAEHHIYGAIMERKKDVTMAATVRDKLLTAPVS